MRRATLVAVVAAALLAAPLASPQQLPPILPLPVSAGRLLAPRVAALSDAVETASAAVDDGTWVQLNGTRLGDGVAAPASSETDAATPDACRSACASTSGCYGATFTVDLDFTACQLYGGGGASPCAPLIASSSDVAVSFLFPGAATAAAARCAPAVAGAPSPPPPPVTVRAAADLCARVPRLCASPTGRRRLAATPLQDAGAAGWGIAVDARHAALTIHGATIVMPAVNADTSNDAEGGPSPSTLEYLGTVSGVPSAKTCEGYCQQMVQAADNGDAGTLVPMTPFDDASPYGEPPFSRLAVAAGPFQSTCLASSWYKLSSISGGGDDRHGHVCDLFGAAPRGGTTLVVAPAGGAAATTSLRAARWSAMVGWAWNVKQEEQGE